jgi:hypothetical protein
MTDGKTYTKEEIDDLCIEFDNRCIDLEDAQRAHSAAKGDLLAAVQAQGHIAPRADKTTRLEGVLYVADSTVGSTVDIDEAAVGELRSELSRLKKPSLFATLFDRKVKHQLRKDAGDTLRLKIGGMADEVQKRLLGIFARCFAVNSKAPTLSVSLASVLQEKERLAVERAAKKSSGQRSANSKQSKGGRG